MFETEENEIIAKKQRIFLEKINITEMENCEYIEYRKKTHSKPPAQRNGKCHGFRNPYDDNIDFVCKNCKNLGDVK